jgi:hypothetical protein
VLLAVRVPLLTPVAADDPPVVVLALFAEAIASRGATQRDSVSTRTPVTGMPCGVPKLGQST